MNESNNPSHILGTVKIVVPQVETDRDKLLDEMLRSYEEELESLVRNEADTYEQRFIASLNVQTFNVAGIREGLNRSVFLRRSSHGGIFRGRRCGFCLLSLTLSYLFVALMPFLRPFLHNRRNTAY